MKKNLFSIVLLLFCLNGFSQNFKVDDVLNIKLRNSGEIMSEDNQVKGYYYFYKVDKADRKNFNYILEITDENLKKINSIDIVKPKHAILIEAEYNGSAFAFLFYDPKTKFIELVTYDKSLAKLGNVSKKVVGKYNLGYYNMYLMGMDPGHTFIVPVRDKGFLFYGFAETKTPVYSIDYYDNSLKKNWTQAASLTDKDVTDSENAFRTGDYVASIITKKKAIRDKDANYFLLLNDFATGKELLNTEIKDDKFNVSASKIVLDEVTGNIMIFGEYYNKEDKEFKSGSLGYFYFMMDLKGAVANKKFVSWEKDIAKFIKVDKAGKMDKGARVFVHDIVRMADGDIFVVGEQYKKAASGWGIASTLLSNGRSGTATVQIEILDLVIFQFSPALDLKSVNICEKDPDFYLLPSGAEWVSTKMLAYYALSNGWFDYAFYQLSKDKKTFISTYINYEKEKGEKGKNVLTSVVYTPEKTFTTDKTPLARKSTDYIVRKGKPGYVMVAEYFKKEKRLDSRLEKVNY